MNGNGAGRRKGGAAASIATTPTQQDKGGLELVPESNASERGPDLDNVIDMVRRSVGSVLEGLTEAKEKARAAKRLYEIAKAAGDHEVKSMMARELQGLREETRLTP